MSLVEARKNHATTDWNVERIALLVELNNTATNAAIAAEINSQTGSSFTRNAIIGKLARLGIEKIIQPGYSRPAKRSQYKSGISRRRLDNLLNGKFVHIEQRPKAPDHLGLTLVQLKNDFSQCRYIDGDNETVPYTFCAQPVTEDSSYCAYHHHLCCKPAEKQKAAA